MPLYLLQQMTRGNLSLLEPLRQLLLGPPFEPDSKALRLDGKTSGIRIALERASEYRPLLDIFCRQHFESDQHANEGNVHLPIGKMRPGEHTRASTKGKVLSASSFSQVHEALR